MIGSPTARMITFSVRLRKVLGRDVEWMKLKMEHQKPMCPMIAKIHLIRSIKVALTFEVAWLRKRVEIKSKS